MADGAQSDPPPVATPQADGTETSDRKDALRNDAREAPANPKMSGAPASGKDDTRGPAANRNPDGPRQAGTTPRPTERPIG